MKNLKYAGLFILLFAITLPVFAQRRFDPSRMAQRQTQQIFDNVKSLTKLQKNQIREIFTQNADTVGKIFNNNSLGRQEKFDRFRKLRTDLNARLKKIFTADQYKQYQEMMAEMRRRFRDRRKN